MSNIRRYSAYGIIVSMLALVIYTVLPSHAAASTVPAAAVNKASVSLAPNSPSFTPMDVAIHRVLTKTQITYTIRVRPGDSLSLIAKRVYGNMDYWPVIWKANHSKIPDFNSLLIGERLSIPSKPAKIPRQPHIISQKPVNSGSGSGGSGPPPKFSGKAGRAVAYVYAQLGCPYVWGGNGPCRDGYDCSGLMQQAWLYAGVSIPRISWEQQSELPQVSLHDLRPGDILGMYGNSHVGMYVGHGMMIDAPVPGAVVEKVPVPWSAVDGAVRP